jgi:SAM-dependent methyltransferase
VHSYRERLMLKQVTGRLREGSILDAGCGTGSLAVALAKIGYDVSGIEQSAPGLAWLRQRASEDRNGLDLCLAQADIQSLPFAVGFFDAVVCGEVLEHLAADAAAVAEIHRVLRPNGLCVATVPADPTKWSVSDECAGHRRRYSRQMLMRLFETNGFRVVTLDNWGFPVIRLYQHLVFHPYMRLRYAQGTTSQPQALPMPNEVRSNRNLGILDRVASLLALCFSWDDMFPLKDWGMGFLLVAQKVVG